MAGRGADTAKLNGVPPLKSEWGGGGGWVGEEEDGAIEKPRMKRAVAPEEMSSRGKRTKRGFFVLSSKVCKGKWQRARAVRKTSEFPAP